MAKTKTRGLDHHARVTIYGAGVTGLTAAHELADRGFRVRLVECAKGRPDPKHKPDGEPELAIGGMARTQFAKVGEEASHFGGRGEGTPVLPGEHGFRFFPSYYHHIFDTMLRTPIYDANGEESGRTIYDNVEPAPIVGIASSSKNPIKLPVAPALNVEDMVARAASFGELGYGPQDMGQALLRMFRYMTTCSARRAADFEDISFWQYLQGYDPKTGISRFRYSKAFEQAVNLEPRVLAAFDAQWGDARTNGDTYVQLLMNYLTKLPKADGTLNGPTTVAWLEPWRAHLERLGVEFVEGELIELTRKQGEIVPKVRDADGKTHDDDADYFVVATDSVTAELVSQSIADVPGVPEQIQGYTTVLLPKPFGGKGFGTPRDPHAVKGRPNWDRFQNLTGVQYFLEQDFKVLYGHMYFADAEWALSSINEQQFWKDRPSLDQNGYRSVMSVDVGAFNVPSKSEALGGRAAWDVSRDELAEETWRQVSRALERHVPTAVAGADVAPIPRPGWYHVDGNMVYGDLDGAQRPVKNLTPYLIPIVGDWKNRPGADPWNPGAGDNPTKEHELPAGVWQAPHGGYWVHCDKLVYAGIYNKTFTRMTTMESANESARHAVNAILDHYVAHHVNGQASGHPIENLSAPERREGAEAYRQGDAPFFRTTPIGDYCRIWDIEQLELPALAPAKKLDAWLFERGLPHAWDLLGVEVMPSILSYLANPMPSGTAAASPLKWLESLGGHAGHSHSEHLQGAQVVLKLLQSIREAMEKAAAAAKQNAQGSGPGNGSNHQSDASR